MNTRKKESNFININVLIEHDEKDGFYKKGNKLDTNNVYINKEFITKVTSPKKEEFYKYKYDDSWDHGSAVIFRVKLSTGDEYTLLETEFDKFKDIL